ncbi:helix-turn-helix domain-containing protein [Streptomyces sp. 4F14]|uniref:helix-turn-helix domain-containing protein n=1 Tax=Streptomyces sp. 4F14 TaxID=3394380 RepID=UPI003A88A40C
MKQDTPAESAPRLDPRAELKEFLRSRRARLKPEDLGLPSYGRRRVPGLRREELAQLAGVSFAYYARLEQGYGDSMSAEVLEAVAQALRLTKDERSHLLRLAQPERRDAPRPRPLMSATHQHMLDALGVPAYITGWHMDILGWNRLATAVFGDWEPLPAEERNLARLIFLSPQTRERFADPDRTGRVVAAILRTHVGKNPEDRRLAALITDLSQRSEEFRRLWARYDVGCEALGDVVPLRHPLVGEYSLVHAPMILPCDPPLWLLAYHAEPGTPAEEALRLLAGQEPAPRH